MNQIHDAAERALPEQLAAVDLNLLVAFDALSRELNVTRAAERVGVTQSAMSHALRRLRELLGDELLIRGRGGMVLTARAESLVVPVRSGLVTLGRALAQPAEFDARSARRSFRIAAPDLFEVLVVPPLLERIRRDAPHVDITLVTPHDQLGDQLETGELDVAIVAVVKDARTSAVERAASSLLQKALFRDRFVCFVRAGHPVLGKKGARARKLSLQAFAKLSHALVSPTGHGAGLVDRVLEQHGLSRRIALRVPHFFPALAIVAKSDLVLTAPRALASVAGELPVVQMMPPVALPDHSINLMWHGRFSRDPGQRWLRAVVAEVARAAQAAGSQ